MQNDQKFSPEDDQAYQLINEASKQLDLSQLTSTLPTSDEGYIVDTGYRDWSHPVSVRFYDK